MDKKQKIKVSLTIALWMSCFFDIITFFMSNTPQFEINPLYLLTKSIVFIIVYKLLVNSGITYLVLKYKPRENKTFRWSYLIILIVIYAFLVQSLGAFSNIKVSSDYEATVGTPEEIQPMEQTEAITSFAWLSLIILYLPFMIAFVSFWIWEKIYL